MDNRVKEEPLMDEITKQNLEEYKTLYQQSINNPDVF